jgi:pimeloyl-ACP methyl ester carboxylesterase
MSALVSHADSADGTRVGWEVAGDGPPLVLLHGSTADRGRWAAVRDALARHFTLHLVDRRGRGLSVDAAGARSYALAREAEDLAAVLAAVGPGALVLAHSYGGTCALEAAAAGAPMARLLVYEPAFGTDAGPVFPAAVLAGVEAALAREDPEAALETFFAGVLLLGPDEIEAMRGTAAWRARVACAPTLAREARAANAYRVDPARLATVSVPTRFLLGTETTPALVRSTRAARAALPGSELRELRGHGHAAMDADPALFVAEVEDWLGVSP